ncbi:hypothetical protein E2C01_051468 [Portunus trituberculatus]|uniref:Uncharacterized protein n=1 Tax=Portunus trituberculatus TaxID=210409 RepID=A0A5B7GKF2_PORTR|nr:hypothetical protein [Portunus trituberculatus]
MYIWEFNFRGSDQIRAALTRSSLRRCGQGREGGREGGSEEWKQLRGQRYPDEDERAPSLIKRDTPGPG